MEIGLLSTLAYIFLYITVIALWIPATRRFPFWYLPLGLALVLGFFAGHLALPAVLSIVILAWSARLVGQRERPWIRGMGAAALVLSGIGLGAHIFPGYFNLKLIDALQVSEDGIPFTLYLNFDKTLVGIFILGEMLTLARTRLDWLELGKKILLHAPVIILLIALLSAALQFVRWDPKLPKILPIWAVTNLLFVCVAEEGFFRGFLQKYLSELWQKFRYGRSLALLTASLLFGVAHFAGGVKYMILSSLAGLGYGWMYQLTGKIEASIITHFFLNLLHILLLSYPALAS